MDISDFLTKDLMVQLGKLNLKVRNILPLLVVNLHLFRITNVGLKKCVHCIQDYI